MTTLIWYKYCHYNDMRIQFFLMICLVSFWQYSTHHLKSDNGKAKIAVQQSPGKEIPVLCYHNIKNVLDGHSPKLTVTEKTFDAQMKMLSDNGYHTILPDQLCNYLTGKAVLPSKPIMLTFDDSHKEHYSIAANEMKMPRANLVRIIANFPP